MTGKSQKLKQDLEQIQEQVSLLSVQLRTIYDHYLKDLTQEIKKQLVLAVYHVCTQIYPRNFLTLSFAQREQLQQNIIHTIPEIQNKLLEILNHSTEDKKGEKEFLISNPEELVHWLQKIEKAILLGLDQLSKATNHSLQGANIFPPHLPPQVIDFAMQSEATGQSVSGSPNLLNVFVETGQKDEQDEDSQPPTQIAKITAIHLRLVEIELASPNLTIQRRQIRTLSEKLNQLRKQYHKKLQDYAIAEAEMAWRSSWHE